MIRLAPRHAFLALLPLLATLAVPLRADPPPNVLFLAIDDLRNDLGALGAAHAKTPSLDAFAATARLFSRHYVQVPTCGASRCALMRGRYPDEPAHLGNDGIKRTAAAWGDASLPGLFRQAGYETLALGKISHYPGNRTGAGWAAGPEELPGVWDRSWIPQGPWATPEAMMHGYANGGARVRGKSLPLEAFDGPDEAYPDAWVAAEAVATLSRLSKSDRPWFFGVGFFKPHLPFAAPKKWHELHEGGVPDLPEAAAAKPDWASGWHASGEFRKNYGHEDGRDPANDAAYARRLREAYAASISYMDAQLGHVLRALDETGLAERTLVVVWSDHGFLLGEHGIWGKHCLYEQALRCPLMIRPPRLQRPGEVSDALVETVDILPTLADLCGLEPPAGLDGVSLRPQLEYPARPSSKPARAFWAGGLRSVRTERWRLIEHPGRGGAPDRYELFDYERDPHETRNHAGDQPELVAELLRLAAPIPRTSPD
jgi:iduronate 2-sulfatase